MSALVIAIFAPVLAAFVVMLVRRRAGLIALAGAGVAAMASAVLLARAFNGAAPTELIMPGLPGYPLRLEAGALTSVLSMVVATVALFVLVFAIGYMKKDPAKPRFFATMLMFIAAMQMLVLSADWILLLAAWELIGVSSYLLIGFWHGKPGVAGAAMRAFIYTRSADLGLYIAAFLLIGVAGTSDISASLATSGSAATLAGLLLLVAAMGKSAQVPLNDWLQRAMAGPTPVSALLHSATLVAAGAILLIRVSPMLPPSTLLVVGLVGGITAVITGLIALGEKDLKRLLAASTSSQYGLMLLAIGVGAPVVALLHLIAHAAIKSGLFMGAGVFQHARGSTLMKDVSGAGREHKRVFAGFVLAALALAGIPPLAGFFSKDAIIAATLYAPAGAGLLPLALAGTVLTGAYMARAVAQLWRGTGEAAAPSQAMLWMGAGMAGPVVLAVILGAGFPVLEELLGAKVVTSALAAVLGLAAAGLGIVLGWFLPPRQLLGPAFNWAQNGFAIAGGMDGLITRPALKIARACLTLDERIFKLALAVGTGAKAVGRAFNTLEAGLLKAVRALGRANMHLGRATRQSDEAGIDAAIFSFARATITTGGRARKLQSGLIHRQLAITIVATGILAAALFAAPLFY
ncbi:MAG: NADH-quinone oxidoreductase subunit L [Rhodobacteraceae bacterium]|nr:NADH-quinone oxidoreductase subunit L [Paracoccaceae bacterium]